MPDRMSKDISNRMSDRVPDRMSEDISDRISESIINKMQKMCQMECQIDMPDRLSDGMN